METQYPELITSDSPTQRVGGTPSQKFQKVKHPTHILSLGNANGVKETRAWFERIARVGHVDRLHHRDHTLAQIVVGQAGVDGHFRFAAEGADDCGPGLPGALRNIEAGYAGEEAQFRQRVLVTWAVIGVPGAAFSGQNEAAAADDMGPQGIDLGV